MSKTWLFTVVVGLATVHSAFAEPPGLTPVTEPAPEPVGSYRLEVAAVDASVVAALALGHGSGAVGGFALATYAVGAPLVHVLHGRPGAAARSMGLRAGMPILGGLVGYGLLSMGHGNSGDDISPGAVGAILGVFAGAIAASAIDIGVLAKGDDVPRVGPAVTPTTNGGMTFGLSGRF